MNVEVRWAAAAFHFIGREGVQCLWVHDPSASSWPPRKTAPRPASKREMSPLLVWQSRERAWLVFPHGPSTFHHMLTITIIGLIFVCPARLHLLAKAETRSVLSLSYPQSTWHGACHIACSVNNADWVELILWPFETQSLCESTIR